MFLPPLEGKSGMGSNSIVSNRWMSEKMNCLDLSPNSNSDNEEEEVHVLAVDDSLVDRKVIERLLKISSCKVTAVDSGWGALKLLGLLDDDEEDKSSSSSSSSSSAGFEGLKVDLIITDYCMPGMTGYELLKKIKESSSFREIPVVIMSSENVMARIDRCLEEGAEEFIAKPVKLSDVKRLRDYYMATREIRSVQSSSNVNKRKLQESFDVSTSSSPPSISPSPSPSSESPPSLFSSSAPCSPSSLDSPTRRIKMTSFD